jgi:hypothetical protein
MPMLVDKSIVLNLDGNTTVIYLKIQIYLHRMPMLQMKHIDKINGDENYL